MTTNDRGQGLMSKYIWVIETIYRARKLSFDELNQRWLRDTDISRGVEIPKRTFDNWRYAIQDLFGLIIENERKGAYRYYILNEDDIDGNGLSSWIYKNFCVSNVLANSQSIKDRILLENVPSGQQHLQTIVEAMKESRLLSLTYQSYWRANQSTFDVQPLCVKLFRQRWYMVAQGLHPTYEGQRPRVYALDRIQQLEKKSEKFDLPKDWNAQDFFDGCFGIIANQQADIELVKLKVSAHQAHYLRDLKLHDSQEETEQHEHYSLFTCRLRPTFDFQQELLSLADAVEVLEPAWLRKEMASRVERMWRKYEE